MARSADGIIPRPPCQGDCPHSLRMGSLDECGLCKGRTSEGGPPLSVLRMSSHLAENKAIFRFPGSPPEISFGTGYGCSLLAVCPLWDGHIGGVAKKTHLPVVPPIHFYGPELPEQPIGLPGSLPHGPIPRGTPDGRAVEAHCRGKITLDRKRIIDIGQIAR